MLPVIGFIVWHDNGTVYRSDTCAWTDIPQVGAQVVAFLHGGRYVTFVYGEDFYSHPDETYVLEGRWMETEAFNALVETALSEGVQNG